MGSQSPPEGRALRHGFLHSACVAVVLGHCVSIQIKLVIYCVELHHLDDVFDRSDSLGRKALPKRGLCATDFSQNACAEGDWIMFDSVAQDGQG